MAKGKELLYRKKNVHKTTRQSFNKVWT